MPKQALGGHLGIPASCRCSLVCPPRSKPAWCEEFTSMFSTAVVETCRPHEKWVFQLLGSNFWVVSGWIQTKPQTKLQLVCESTKSCSWWSAKETPAEGKSTELASKWLTSTTKIATSACTAPCTMLGTKSRWPGTSKMVNCPDRLS